MSSIIAASRSIMPACDVGVERYEEIVRETCEIPQIRAYKIGAALALSVGLPRVVELANATVRLSRRVDERRLLEDGQGRSPLAIPEGGGRCHVPH